MPRQAQVDSNFVVKVADGSLKTNSQAAKQITR